METTLDDVRITDELRRRPAGPCDPRAENAAFLDIARTFSSEPQALLRALTLAAIRLCGAGTCGVSLLDGPLASATVFRWITVSGALHASEGGTTPARFSPCGIALQAGRPELFKYPGRYFPYFADACPPIVECLVMPFSGGDVVGTIWIVAHDETTRFTQSHVDIMSALADFTVAALGLLNQEGRARALAESEASARREAEAANGAKDLFLAMVSHELRTPLNSILGWSELLAAGDLAAADEAMAVAVIHSNALRQSRVVEDLIDVSRAEPEDLPLERACVDIRDAISRAVNAALPGASAAALRLETRLGSAACLVRGDADRLQQLFSNLLGNAVKFTPAGGTILVESSASVNDVTIRVTDNGIGIDAAFLPHVFDRFRQADSSTRRQHRGVGLGLTIARRIVQQHGGQISARSSGIGQGTSFTMVLPRVADGVQPVASAARHAGYGDLREVRVLVLDDEPDTCEAFGLMLIHHGATVWTASSVDEALEVCRARALDVVLADIALPGQDGYELVKQLRSGNDIRNRRLAIAALTARASTGDQARSLERGFDLYLTKPIEAATLIAAVAAMAQLARDRVDAA